MDRISPKDLTPDRAGRAIQQQLNDALTRLHQDVSQEFEARIIASVPGMKYAMARFSFSPAVSEWLSRGAPMRGNLTPRMQFLDEWRAARQALATEGREAQSNKQLGGAPWDSHSGRFCGAWSRW